MAELTNDALLADINIATGLSRDMILSCRAAGFSDITIAISALETIIELGRTNDKLRKLIELLRSNYEAVRSQGASIVETALGAGDG